MINYIHEKFYFLTFFLKKSIFSYAFLFGMLSISLFYTTLLSSMSITMAFEWTVASPIFICDLMLLGIIFFEYEKNKYFFSKEKKKNNTLTYFVCLIAFNTIIFLILFLWTAFFILIDKIKFYSSSLWEGFELKGIKSVNWLMVYYFMILLSILSLGFFLILLQIFKYKKNYFFSIFFLFLFLLVTPIGIISFHADYLMIQPPNTLYAANDKIIIFDNSQYSAYDQQNNCLYIYPFYNSYSNHYQKYDKNIFLFIIDPLLCFMYLFRITTFNLTYLFDSFSYNNQIYQTSDLTIKTVYFPLELWTGYFWFMLYPYLYGFFLFSIYRVYLTLAKN